MCYKEKSVTFTLKKYILLALEVYKAYFRNTHYSLFTLFNNKIVTYKQVRSKWWWHRNVFNSPTVGVWVINWL